MTYFTTLLSLLTSQCLLISHNTNITGASMTINQKTTEVTLAADDFPECPDSNSRQIRPLASSVCGGRFGGDVYSLNDMSASSLPNLWDICLHNRLKMIHELLLALSGYPGTIFTWNKRTGLQVKYSCSNATTGDVGETKNQLMLANINVQFHQRTDSESDENFILSKKNVNATLSTHLHQCHICRSLC